MAIRCRIFVDDASIVKTDYGREVVQFTQISSWRYNKRTGTVMLRLLDDNEELAVSNWAMSIDKSKLLAKVMKAKVGPPSE